ncbi:nucleotide disphospho-sugar-binding domain-containing protein [Mycolicibacterium sp. lyk4-40-TYG-92]|jgi:UDP:flavonoid glycosyltransferase YjiC (YdhE family)|uniref:glycosyltransferase n=1 Tax=Mycolicibacterium sp. lyk4-40-TYG-92 TaxID=3040295 RepID=UPI00254AF207|nr:nucleotide disphospho-sugar-binding domain-containing protein [Mycolicibacterium sp. lyk4-40-TYG-92]
MKILWAIVDGGGNIPPQIAVARALRQRGVDVHFIGHTGARERVETAGFSFETFNTGREFDPTTPRSLAAMMTTFVREMTDRSLGPQVLDAARRHCADAIVVDTLLVAVIADVLKHGIPAVVFVHCFYRAVQDMAAGPAGWYTRLRGMDPRAPEHADALQVVAARADLDPVRGTPPVVHTGVVWQGTPAPSVGAETPRILVSLSTCGFGGQGAMLQNILDALAPLPVEVTVTAGASVDTAGLRLPANATLHAWLDHDEVLATASLVVGHGGHSTTMRALSFDVPLVIMPANPMIDQKGVGAAIERAGAGIALPKKAGAEQIRAAVQRVLAIPGYRRAAAALGADIRKRDGAEVAADAISAHLGLTSIRP